MGCSKKICPKSIIKICFLLGLLFIFFKVYFINQVTDFAKGLSTVSTRYEHPESLEPPTITICFNEAFKTSVAKKYGINDTYDIANPKFDYPYDEVTYKLNRDFRLIAWIEEGINEHADFTQLQKGPNTVRYKNESYEFFVDFVQTFFNAKCTKIMPKFMVKEFPFYVHVQVVLKSFPRHEDQPTGLKIYLTSNDTWQGILADQWVSFQPTILNIDFKETYSKEVAFISPKLLLFKNGVDSPTKCVQRINLQVEKCGFECNPWISYDQDKQMCSIDDMENNKNGSECLQATILLYHNCLNPKKALLYHPTITTPRYYKKIQDPTIEVSLDIMTNIIEIREEKLITETHDFIGSLGGSLGMFFGFAIISWIFTGIDKIFEKLTQFFM